MPLFSSLLFSLNSLSIISTFEFELLLENINGFLLNSLKTFFNSFLPTSFKVLVLSFINK